MERQGVILRMAITKETPNEAELMRIFPLSSSLPLCNSIVVLDERPTVKGNSFSLPSRLLIDGCERRRVTSHRSMTGFSYHN